ncbi:MAG: methyltransferase domain-containing protein [Deltaproteobacteria bacterium]|nr:methyltransferase domain-containing protein [Deltaproteobacteria bacterium]
MAKHKALFDTWPDRYDRWFETPLGSLIRYYEAELIKDMLLPAQGDFILDAGCGTGVFTLDFLLARAHVIGFDISLPMLERAIEKLKAFPFQAASGDMRALPFGDGLFDKAVSITALEFIPDAEAAVSELFRVVKSGGIIVVATLNSLSPWAERREVEAKKTKTVFSNVIFRSPQDVLALAPVEGEARTAIHFADDEDPQRAREIEDVGNREGLETGAFLAARWVKP